MDQNEVLHSLYAWLLNRVTNNLSPRQSGKGGHDGDGNAWTVCEIPDWEVRQKMLQIEAALTGTALTSTVRARAEGEE